MKSSVNISQATFYAIRPEFFPTSQKRIDFMWHVIAHLTLFYVANFSNNLLLTFYLYVVPRQRCKNGTICITVWK